MEGRSLEVGSLEVGSLGDGSLDGGSLDGGLLLKEGKDDRNNVGSGENGICVGCIRENDCEAFEGTDEGGKTEDVGEVENDAIGDKEGGRRNGGKPPLEEWMEEFAFEIVLEGGTST